MTKRRHNPKAAPQAAAELKAPDKAGTAVVQPRTGTVLRWDPDKIALAESRANCGDFSLMGELCERMMPDDRVSQGLNRLFAATTLPLAFEVPGKTAEQSKNDKICQALTADFWKMVPEGAAKEIMAWLGLAHMCLVHVDEWKIDPETGRAIPVLTVWSLRFLRYDADRGWLVRTAKAGINWSFTEEPLTDGDGNWILLRLGTSWRTVVTAPWASVARWWLLKAYATVDWPANSERHGQGTAVAKNLNEEIKYTPESREKLAKQINEGGRNKTIVLPDGYELDLVVDTANTWTTFKAQIEIANLAISIGLVGTNLTTEVQGGSFAAAEVHKTVDASRFRSLLECLATELRQKLLVFWALFNFGAASLKSTPYPKWDTAPPEDLAAFADTQLKGAQAVKGWLENGVKLSRKWVVEKYSLVEAETPDDLLVPPAPPTPPAQGGAKEATGEEDDDVPGKEGPPKKQPKPGKASGARGHEFHAEAKDDSAFAASREYVDRLEEKLRGHAAVELAPTLASVLVAIRGAKDYEELQEMLREAYRDEKPVHELVKLTEQAIVMAQLAGRDSIEQELNED